MVIVDQQAGARCHILARIDERHIDDAVECGRDLPSPKVNAPLLAICDERGFKRVERYNLSVQNRDLSFGGFDNGDIGAGSFDASFCRSLLLLGCCELSPSLIKLLFRRYSTFA